MSKRIQGITIEIDGSTTKLNDALKSTNRVISSTNSEIKALNQALKLDPKNTELLAQKQEVLKKNISATTDKLNALKTAQKQMGDYNKLTDEQKENYRALSVEITKTEAALKGMNNEAKNTSKVDMSKLKSGLEGVGKVAADVAKKMAAVTAAMGGALVAIVAQGVKSYASLEQNIGGINKLFGESADQVIEDAKRAYKEAGLSANQYMETATSFSASLLKGLNGDTKLAADLTNRAIKDMSDNANTFGTSMEDVMNVYKALSKEQYTTLDNLRLGYAGTKTGMQQLIKDAASYTDIQKELGITVDASSMSFDNMIKAISVIQKHLNITGTTMKEAEGTITGSFNMMRAAWDNFLNGMGDASQLGESALAFVKNIANAVLELAPNILTGLVNLVNDIVPELGKVLIEVVPKLAQQIGEIIPQLFETLVPMLGQLITDTLPPLLDAVEGLIDSLLDMVSGDTSEFEKVIGDIILSVVTFLTKNLPKLIKIILQLIPKIALALIEQIPTIIESLVTMLVELLQTIIESLPKFIEVAVKLVIALAKGLIQAIPELIKAIPKLIITLVTELVKPEFLMMIIKSAITLVVELAKGLIQAIPELLKAIPQIISALVSGLVDLITKTDWGSLGKNILNGILNGLINFGSLVTNAIKKLGNKILGSIKSFFGIHSPSTLMEDEIGTNLTAGIVEGMENSIPNAIKDVNRAMTDLNNGIQASVNPVINPSANTNPLYLTIDKFYNNRETDIQQLAQELEFYRKNTALAKGGM